MLFRIFSDRLLLVEDDSVCVCVYDGEGAVVLTTFSERLSLVVCVCVSVCVKERDKYKNSGSCFKCP